MDVNELLAETALTRVMRGAAYLDGVKPLWYTTVDIDRLAMSEARNCIAGQVFQDEADRYESLEIQNGYDLLYYEHDGAWLMSHGFLFQGRDEWIEQIRARILNDLKAMVSA